MDFLVLSRAAAVDPAAGATDEAELNERHWSYMDRFSDGMTARGPLLGADRETWQGSMHVVSLPSAEAVGAFVDEEPYQRAGLFASHAVWRFANRLGRTMWEYAGPQDGLRFLVLSPADWPTLPPTLAERTLVHGELRTLDDEPAGTLLAVAADSRSHLDRLLAEAGLVDAEVHDWELGGRR